MTTNTMGRDEAVWLLEMMARNPLDEKQGAALGVAITALTAQPSAESMLRAFIERYESRYTRETMVLVMAEVTARARELDAAHHAPQQPEAQAVARIVIVDRGGGFKAIRTWDDIGDLPPGEHFLFSATHPSPQQPAGKGGAVAFGKLSECPPEFEAPPMTEAERAAKINEFKAKLTRAEAADQTGEKVRGLVEKWREKGSIDYDLHWPELSAERYILRGYAKAKREDADELEAALSANGENEDTTHER